MNSDNSGNHVTGEHRRQKQRPVTGMAAAIRTDSSCDDHKQDPQNKKSTTLISGDVTTDPLYQLLRTAFAKTSEKKKVLKSFMKTDMHVHFARHCDHVAAQAVLNKLNEGAKKKHGCWGATDCATALLKLYYLLKQPGNQGTTHSKEAQGIIGLVENCADDIATPSQPAATESRTGQGARNPLSSASSSIRYFSEWEQDWTADPAYPALLTPFIRKSERVAVIKSFVNKPPCESFTRYRLHCASDLFEEIKEAVKRDRYWNVHFCATSIIRLHQLLLKDNAYKSPTESATEVLPSHVQKLMKVYKKCVLKSKAIKEKKLDGSLKPGCTLEDFDKSVEDRYIESFKKKRVVSLQEMLEKRKRDTKLIEDCSALLAGLQDNPEDERQHEESNPRSVKKRKSSRRKNNVVTSETTTSTTRHAAKKLKKTIGNPNGSVASVSPSRLGVVSPTHQPPAYEYHPGRVPSVLYDPALAPPSWTFSPQYYSFLVALNSGGLPTRDMLTQNQLNQNRGVRDSPATAYGYPPYPVFHPYEVTAGANSYNGNFRSAHTEPSPSSPSFYRSYHRFTTTR